MKRIADVGAAVIRTGFIGIVHIEALRWIGVQVRGVLGSTPERGEARAQALGVDRAYPMLEALLDDPSVHVVHVTSPNHLHVPQARAILAAGRHIVCEKPLAMTAAESSGLVRLAAERGVVNAVNFNIRFYPLHQPPARAPYARSRSSARPTSSTATWRTRSSSWTAKGGIEVRNEAYCERGRIVHDLGSTPIRAFSRSRSATSPRRPTPTPAGSMRSRTNRAWPATTSQFRHFFEAFRAGTTPRETFEDGYVNTIIDVAYRSMTSERWEPVETNAAVTAR